MAPKTALNRRIALYISEPGRNYLESIAKDHNVHLSDVIRVALAMAGERPSEFENRVSQIKARF